MAVLSRTVEGSQMAWLPTAAMSKLSRTRDLEALSSLLTRIENIAQTRKLSTEAIEQLLQLSANARVLADGLLKHFTYVDRRGDRRSTYWCRTGPSDDQNSH